MSAGVQYRIPLARASQVYLNKVQSCLSSRSGHRINMIMMIPTSRICTFVRAVNSTCARRSMDYSYRPTRYGMVGLPIDLKMALIAWRTVLFSSPVTIMTTSQPRFNHPEYAMRGEKPPLHPLED
ncbi:hypothetical protein AcW1_008640 [Taiwanofungus camphoratus]|nr:hypothetical protein AcV5_006659 [Antrodia cinnamomea]KAI0948895.1 hypothetical protein AcW1_008640 [Antrodia cinnamomea]